ncbi:aldo/keto reductase [Helicobacter muridarum]|uniref:Oxidoreductase, aldo/keto reductase family n=2 Tax=Helicobacter muridarum TaxID=216 RepID=A0A377PWG3_9HELI|nr:aldo/keto reductase [Helicobacter muridarum]STQ86591.1 oxidoreductase, aldo/keto reductase family [Helicobacter muridarum]
MRDMTRRDFIKMTAIVSSTIGLGMLTKESIFTSAHAFSSRFQIQGPFSTQKLNNNVKMPIFGFGTYGLNGEKGVNAILNALNDGYRLIDTATRYDTEREVGEAVIRSKIPRDDIFITSKLWNDKTTSDETIESVNESLAKLKMDYIDLYLIHFPQPKKSGPKWLERDINVWEAMEKLYKQGKVKAIGISNFYPHHLEAFIPECNIKPMVNQIEVHPFYVDDKLIDICRHHKIAIQAYSPLARGKEALLNPVLKKIGNKYNKTVAQVMLRWSLQKGFVPLPRSANPDRIRENINVFDFSLNANDMSLINKLKVTNNKIIPIS